MLSKPFSLVRGHDAEPHPRAQVQSSFNSLVLNGRPGTGNSFLLLQAAEYTEATGWIRALHPASTPHFSASPPSTRRTSTSSPRAPRSSSRAPPPSLAPAVLEQLAAQSRFPVLIAIDDFQALYGRSLYRDPFFHFVRPHRILMPRLLEYASGRRTFTRGLVLGALTRSNPQFPVPP
ncbi:hypothetical protein C8J57DRAFT_288111 [Mycena rebaudengoi]|nr:hypothetical protein C8J57DRAFT_288111 [Mycena rebaudengoi]